MLREYEQEDQEICKAASLVRHFLMMFELKVRHLVAGPPDENSQTATVHGGRFLVLVVLCGMYFIMLLSNSYEKYVQRMSTSSVTYY